MKKCEIRREYLKKDFVADDFDNIKPYMQELVDRKIDSLEDLKNWVKDKYELSDAIGEEYSKAYVDMTCDTRDDEIENKYLNIIKNIFPKLASYNNLHQEKFLNCKYIKDLPKEDFELYIKRIHSDKSIFNEENIQLLKEESILVAEYKKKSAAIVVDFDGKIQNAKQMSKYMVGKDKEKRKQAWIALHEKRIEVSKDFSELYDKLVKLRHKIALNSGFNNFNEYKFVSEHRYDYSIDMCREFHDSIEKNIVPILKKIHKRQIAILDTDKINVWDSQADPEGRDALIVYDDIDEYKKNIVKIFSKVLPEFGDEFDFMVNNDLMDLESRLGKAPGGYQISFRESKNPFIFANFVGTAADLKTMLHEGGHAFHYFNSRFNFPYVHPGKEFAEVASKSMELLALPFTKNILFDEEEYNRYSIRQFEGIISFLPWMAKIDAYQLWVYENPESSMEDRDNYWYSLCKRFDTGYIDYSDYENDRKHGWQIQQHIFASPLYYIEYGIAQTGALQIWMNAIEDFDKAVEDYKKALSFGGKKGLKKLFEAANAEFDLSSLKLKELAGAVDNKLQELYG